MSDVTHEAFRLAFKMGMIQVVECQSCFILLDKMNCVAHALWHERNGLTMTGKPRSDVESLNKNLRLRMVE